MGMSASQARFLSLTARKNNVEFEGQQINQQRTTLSNQSGSYYSELCNMVVPTPPSVDDYTKVTYTFDDGALTNTITTMIAKGNNEYAINYIQQWQDDYSIVSASSSIISKNDQNEYSIGSTKLRKLGAVAGYTSEQIKNMSDTDFETLQENDAIKSNAYLSTLDKNQLAELLEQESYYETMLNTSDKVAETGEWYVRYVKNSSTGSYVPYFYNAGQVEDDGKYTQDGVATENINCYSIGSTTKTKEVLNAVGMVEQDTSGRYLSITLYQTDEDGNKLDEDGNLAKESGKPPVTTTYNLVTNTSTDEDAYNDAMNKYNYEQYQYDQKIQDINAKIEIIQQQDKSLELELKQLDTEESAISTEMDAVKKVISKNIENSFKTFNA